jgi:hypothetical protein
MFHPMCHSENGIPPISATRTCPITRPVAKFVTKSKNSVSSTPDAASAAARGAGRSVAMPAAASTPPAAPAAASPSTCAMVMSGGAAP